MYWYILGIFNGTSHFWSKMYWYILGSLDGALATKVYWYILDGLTFWHKMYWYILGGLNGTSHFWSKMYWYILSGPDGALANVSCFWMWMFSTWQRRRRHWGCRPRGDDQTLRQRPRWGHQLSRIREGIRSTIISFARHPVDYWLIMCDRDCKGDPERDVHIERKAPTRAVGRLRQTMLPQ